MLLHELDNKFFEQFESRIYKWSWNETGSDVSYSQGTTFVPVIYTYSQPIARKRLGEYQTEDPLKEVGYPFISIEPLQYYRYSELVYVDEVYVPNGTTVSVFEAPVRFIFPYRVTGVTNNFLDHRILSIQVLEKVFPFRYGQRWMDNGTTTYRIEIEDPEEVKDAETGVHQFSAIFNLHINLITMPEVIDPSIGVIKLNIYNDGYEPATTVYINKG